jgi:hypothetical protein
LFLGQNLGAFGLIKIDFISLWPLILIFLGLSLFKVKERKGKVVGVLVVIVVFILSTITILSSGNTTDIILSGNIVEEERNIEAFSKIVFEGVGDIKLIQGNETKIFIKGDESVVDEIGTEVVENTLSIKYKRSIWGLFLFEKAKVDIEITTNNVEAISLIGAGSILAEDIVSESLDVNISGVGEVTLENIEIGVMTSRIVGLGEMNLSGSTTRQIIYISGTGDYNALELESSEAGVRISGVGDVFINTRDELDVSVSGAGDVLYIGDPNISRNSVSGVGNVDKIDEESGNKEVDLEEFSEKVKSVF